MEALITRIYKEFIVPNLYSFALLILQLFHGTLEYIRESNDEATMREIFEKNFPPLIQHLDSEKFDVNTSLEGIFLSRLLS